MQDDVTSAGPLGGEGKIVEADETYFGKRETPVKTRRGNRPYTKGVKSGSAQKRAVVALVERGGKGRPFHVHHATAESVRAVDRQSVVSGKSVSVRVDLGGRRVIKKKITTLHVSRD